MKWLLVFGIIAIIANAPITLAGDSDEDSSNSSDSSSLSDSSSSSSSSESKHPSSTKNATVAHKSAKNTIVVQNSTKRPSVPQSSTRKTSVAQQSTKNTSVKLIKATILKASCEYYQSEGTAQVKKVNESHNALAVNFTLKKDLPLDTKVVVKVYGSESKDGNYRSISSYSLGLGETSNRYYKYLPAGVIQDCQIAKTLKKGSYKSEDYGFFKFHELLSQRQLKHSYFKIVYNYECSGEVVLSLDQRFQSIVHVTKTSC